MDPPQVIAMPFFRHPETVGMTYVSHARFSLKLSFLLGKACVASLVHAVWPDVLETYTSSTVQEVTRRLEEAGSRAAEGSPPTDTRKGRDECAPNRKRLGE